MKAVQNQNAETFAQRLFFGGSSSGESDSCGAVRCGDALRCVCRLSLLAVRADEMLHISLRLVLRSARGADFDDRLLFHSGVTDIILRHF